MPVLPVALLPQVPVGREGLVRAPRWASLFPPFHTDVFAKQGKSYVLLPSPVTWQGTGNSHWPDFGQVRKETLTLSLVPSTTSVVREQPCRASVHGREEELNGPSQMSCD